MTGYIEYNEDVQSEVQIISDLISDPYKSYWSKWCEITLFLQFGDRLLSMKIAYGLFMVSDLKSSLRSLSFQTGSTYDFLKIWAKLILSYYKNIWSLLYYKRGFYACSGMILNKFSAMSARIHAKNFHLSNNLLFLYYFGLYFLLYYFFSFQFLPVNHLFIHCESASRLQNNNDKYRSWRIGKFTNCQSLAYLGRLRELERSCLT